MVNFDKEHYCLYQQLNEADCVSAEYKEERERERKKTIRHKGDTLNRASVNLNVQSNVIYRIQIHPITEEIWTMEIGPFILITLCI